MKTVIKLLVMLALVFSILVCMSYIGARARVSVFLGSPLPSLGKRVTSFDFDGIPQFVGNPIAWTFTYGPGELPGTPRFQVFVSPTGRLIGTFPRDLLTRITAYKDRLLNP